MASEMFYSLNKRKIKNFFDNFQELLNDKDYHEISVEDILNYTGISRSTFYNYFENIQEVMRDFQEYRFRKHIEMVMSIGIIKTDSIFAMVDAIHKELENLAEKQEANREFNNFVNSPDRIVKPVFSREMEQFVENLLKIFAENTVEGKKINNASKLYTLLSDLSYILIMSYESLICKKVGVKSSLTYFDWDFSFNVIKEGFKRLYP